MLNPATLCASAPDRENQTAGRGKIPVVSHVAGLLLHLEPYFRSAIAAGGQLLAAQDHDLMILAVHMMKHLVNTRNRGRFSRLIRSFGAARSLSLHDSGELSLGPKTHPLRGTG